MKRLFLLALVILLVAVAGCSASSDPNASEGGSISQAGLQRDAPGSEMFFRIRGQQAGDPVGIDFRGSVSSGVLRAQLVDAQGAFIWSHDAQGGSFSVNTTVPLPAAGDYQLGIAWEGLVQAQYDLVWQPHAIAAPVIRPIALLGGLGMIVVALGFLLYAVWRRLPGRYLAFGAGMWVLTVFLKFVWAIAANGPVYNAVTAALPNPVAIPLVSVYVGALTGVFEVGITYLVLRKWGGRAAWKSALAFGVGFGAVEALLLGLNSAATIAFAISSPSGLSLGMLETLAVANNPLFGLASIWERLFTVWVHILSNVLIFYALAARRPRAFWLAFLFKTLIDSVAGYAQISGLLNVTGDALVVNMWVLELIVAAFGLVGWWGTRRVEQRYPAPPESPASVSQAAPLPAE